jgi:hypothetical protein
VGPEGVPRHQQLTSEGCATRPRHEGTTARTNAKPRFTGLPRTRHSPCAREAPRRDGSQRTRSWQRGILASRAEAIPRCMLAARLRPQAPVLTALSCTFLRCSRATRLSRASPHARLTWGPHVVLASARHERIDYSVAPAEPGATVAKRGGRFIGKWHAARCCSPKARSSGTSSAHTSCA